MKEYVGECFCGVIEFKLKGEPLFTQYCHCNKCREIASLSQNAVDKNGYNFTAAYLTSMLTFVKGNNEFEIVPRNTSDLYLCRHCKSLIYGISQDPSKQRGIGVNVNNVKFEKGVVPDTFKADKHIWYQEKVQRFNDELPKYKDAPVEQFGTGDLITELNDRFTV